MNSFRVKKDGAGVRSSPTAGKGGLLENQFQAELYRARASRTHGRVGGGDVGSGAAAAEARHRRIIEAETILATIRIGEVGMVENVEELSAELRAEALAQMPVLSNREV